jgi:hypothetical protein
MLTGLTLSQLLQHPALASASPFQPKHHQQQRQQPVPGPGQAFAQQMLNLYHAEQQVQAPGPEPEASWQPMAASRISPGASPVSSASHPPVTGPGAAQEELRQVSPGFDGMAGGTEGDPFQTKSAPVSGSGSFTRGPVQQPPLLRDSSPEPIGSVSPSYSYVRAAANKGANQQLPLQVNSAGGGRNVFLQTSMSPEAGQVLAGSVSSWYDGGGPLTAGARQQWNLSQGSGMQHGRGLEQVRLGAPGSEELCDATTKLQPSRCTMSQADMCWTPATYVQQISQSALARQNTQTYDCTNDDLQWLAWEQVP